MRTPLRIPYRLTAMETFLVCVSDRRSDLTVSASETAADVWCYDVEAEDAQAAVGPAVERWRAEVGQRPLVSLSVARLSTLS